MRELMVEDVVLQSTFPMLLPAGASCGLQFDLWPTQTNRQSDGGPLGPLDAEEDARGEDRLLTKRCIKWQWKNACLRVKRQRSKVSSSSQFSILCSSTGGSPDRRRQRGNLLILRRCDECRMIGELAKRISICSKQSARKPAPKNKWESTMAPTEVSTATNPLVTGCPQQGKPAPNVQTEIRNTTR